MVNEFHLRLSTHLKNFHGLSLSTLHHYSEENLTALHLNHHSVQSGKNVVHEADHAFVLESIIGSEDIAWEDQSHG